MTEIEIHIHIESDIEIVNSILNLGDICSVDISSLPVGITLLTHGSPCTSFSRAGYQLGGDRGSGTPSSLMWNSVEIIRHSQPKFVIWENVSNVLAKKHKHNFEEYLEVLNEMGYNYKIPTEEDYVIYQKEVDADASLWKSFPWYDGILETEHCILVELKQMEINW